MNIKSRKLEIYPELLDDLINLEYLIVFNNYGITLYSIDIGRVEILDLLISGLLQAIITMIKEISPQKFSKKEDRVEVKEISSGEQGLIVYYCQSIPSDENSIIVACFCSKTCSNHFKTRMKEVTSNFSIFFRKEIISFAGNTNPFIDSGTFFESYLWIDILYPLRLTKSIANNIIDEDSDQIELYNIIEEFFQRLAHNEGIFVKEIIQIALRKLKLTYFDLLALIIKFFKDSILKPVPVEYSTIGGEILRDSIEENETFDKIESNPLDSNNSTKKISQISEKTENTPMELYSSQKIKNYSTGLNNNSEDKESNDLSNLVIGQSQKDEEIKSDWFQIFLDKLMATPETTIKNDGLIISTLIREIEYEFYLKDSKLYRGNLKDIKNINFTIKHYILRNQSKNVFSGPKFILTSNPNKRTIISGMLTKTEYFIVLGH